MGGGKILTSTDMDTLAIAVLFVASRLLIKIKTTAPTAVRKWTEKGKTMKIKTHFARVTVDIIGDQPYYNIMYFDPRDGEYHVGFGSYNIENTFGWLRENFEINCGGYDDPAIRLKEELKIRCDEFKELKYSFDILRDENSKLGVQYEKLLKEKSDLERQMGYLEGQVEAYRFVWGFRKDSK